MRALVLVDGEHHPDAVRAVIADLDEEVVGAVFCGGAEKTDPAELDGAYGVPVVSGQPLEEVVRRAIDRWTPEVVINLADEPVLPPARRFPIASVVLAAGIPYRGADIDLRPPRFADVLTKPSVRVIATQKRAGKTAVASAFARRAVATGRRPIIVAIGRGGPNPPRLIEAGAALDPANLLALADGGLHAASDYVEDAVTSGCATIGCSRVGGGLAGATVYSNVVEGARMAETRHEDLVILEGSGATIPEVKADRTLLCVPAFAGPQAVTEYLGSYRVLLADVVVVTMAGPAAVIEAAVHATVPGLPVVPVAFRPHALADISGRRVVFCTTATTSVAQELRADIQTTHDCEVVGVTSNLGDRRALPADLDGMPDHDVLLTELKGAAVDIAVRHAGPDRVVFCDNVPTGDGLEDAFDALMGER